MHDIRVFKLSDQEQVNSWHKLRGTPELELDFIPEFGLIKPGVCAGFLYKTDCKLASIGNVISNPQSDKNERSKSLNTIIEMLYQKAVLDGFKMITISTNLPKAKERYNKLGFIDGDSGVNVLYRRNVWV